VSWFLAWWLGELGALAPGVLRRGFTSGHGILCFEAATDELVVTTTIDNMPAQISRIDLRQPAEALRAAVASVLRKHAPKGTGIVLLLGAEQVLHKVLDLPLAAEEELRELLD